MEVHPRAPRTRQWEHQLARPSRATRQLKGNVETQRGDVSTRGKDDPVGFTDSVGGLTVALREAPLEPFEGVVISRARRRLHVPLARVAVAMAVAAIGLGSVLASVQLKGSSVVSSRVRETPAIGGPDALNMRALVVLEQQRSAALSNTPTRAVHGGRVVLEP